MTPKAPFPYFGGKSRVASLVWSRFGDPDNYVEPFAGSLAVLLGRPTTPRVETVNDVNCYLSNFWRAIKHVPDAVAEHADWPVSEVDLHARHRWLVLSQEASVFRERMRTDPDHYDARIAGWWVWGACCWIGSGWCEGAREPAQVPDLSSGGVGDHANSALHEKRPVISADGSLHGRGIHGDAGLSQQVPRLTNDVALRTAEPHLSEKLPKLEGFASGCVPESSGTHLSQQVPLLRGTWGMGVNSDNRPQLADAYDIGRGVNANGNLGTCAARRAWLCDWLHRLADRFRLVRVCCGHWLRVCDSPSVTTRLGATAVFLDPPYPTHTAEGEESRSGTLYASDNGKGELNRLRDEVLAYCRERGPNPQMRLAVCGYDTDGYASLVAEGWQEVAWKAQGGYGNRSAKGKANSGRERIWFSPHCRNEPGLFDALEDPCSTPTP